MLTIKYIENQKDEVIRRLAVKGFHAGEIIGQLLDTDRKSTRLNSSH